MSLWSFVRDRIVDAIISTEADTSESFCYDLISGFPGIRYPDGTPHNDSASAGTGPRKMDRGPIPGGRTFDPRNFHADEVRVYPSAANPGVTISSLGVTHYRTGKHITINAASDGSPAQIFIYESDWSNTKTYYIPIDELDSFIMKRMKD